MGTDSRHGLRSALVALLLLGLSGVPARADDAAPAPLAASDKLSMEQLEEIVGPVALYPDIVLAAIMPASTDPVNLVKLAQWLAGQTAPVTEVPADQNFGDTVSSMVQYPDVVAWMNKNLDWVDQMGWAVTNQQDDVLKAVQSFRQKCKASGNLESNDQMVVETEQVPPSEGSSTSSQVIVIESASPSVVYVPTYVPSQVCCYASPTPLLSFGVGVAVGAAGAWAMHSIGWGYGGGWGFGYNGGNAYHGGDVNINRNTNVNVNQNNFNGSRSQPWKPAANANSTRPPPRNVKQPSAAGWGSAAGTRPGSGTGAGAGAASGVRAPKPSTLPAGAQRPGAAPARPTPPPASPAFSGDRGAAGRGDSSRGNASLGSGGKGPTPTPAPARPAPSAKPSPAPARPAPSAKPTPSPSSGGAFGGGSGSGSSARSASSRGNSSTGRSGSAPSGGGGRSGGGGGGGGRGGGRR